MWEYLKQFHRKVKKTRRLCPWYDEKLSGLHRSHIYSQELKEGVTSSSRGIFNLSFSYESRDSEQP